MKTRQIIIISIPLLIIVLGVLLKNYFANKKTETEKISATNAIRFVKTDTVQYTEIETGISAFGRVSSAQSINLIAEVGGQLLQGDIVLEPAQSFQKGQRIFKIDDTEARLTLQSQKSEFINSVAAILPDLKMDFQDVFEKWEMFLQKIEINKNLPELPEIKGSKEKIFLSNKKILTQYYGIKSSEERLGRYDYAAPYNGSIAELKVEIGSIVNANTQIARIIRTDEMETEIPIQAESIEWVEKGAEVKLFSQDRAMAWNGRVSRISDFVDANSQSIKIFVSIVPNNEFKIYEGFYLLAEIPGKKIAKAMEIPRAALIDEKFLWVVENGKLKSKKIIIHKINQKTILFSGLNEGEFVIVETIANAAENMSVVTSVKDIPLDTTSIKIRGGGGGMRVRN